MVASCGMTPGTTRNASPFVSVVIPCYNEEPVLAALHDRLTSVLSALGGGFELIFINDGSEDRTLDILLQRIQAHPEIRVVDFSRNFGHQVAVSAGMEYAVGDVVVLIDADLQDPPELIPSLIEQWHQGYDVVYAVREAREGESWLKKLTARIFYRIISRLTDVSIPVDTGDFRLMDRNVVADLRLVHERHRFIRGLVSWVGYKQIGVPYKRDRRYAGTSKYPFRKMLAFAFDGITSFSTKPLRWAGYFGSVAALLGFLGILWAFIAHYTVHSTIQGWASLMIGVLFIGGVQLLVLGVLGEYVGRIYDEVRQRPLYLVRHAYNMGEALTGELAAAAARDRSPSDERTWQRPKQV